MAPKIEQSVQTTIRIPARLVGPLDRYVKRKSADRPGLTRADVIREAVAKLLKEEESA